jgi:hypothetical protein
MAIVFCFGSFVVVVVGVVSICFLSAFRKTNDFEKNRWNERHSLRVYRGPALDGALPMGMLMYWIIIIITPAKGNCQEYYSTVWGIIIFIFFFRFKGKKRR